MWFSHQVVIAKKTHCTFQTKDEHTFPTGHFPQNSPKSNMFCNSWDKWNSAKVLPEGTSFLLPWKTQYHFVALHASKLNLCFLLTPLPSMAIYDITWISLLKAMLELPASASEFPEWLIPTLLFLKFLQTFYIITDLLKSKRGPGSIYTVNSC